MDSQKQFDSRFNYQKVFAKGSQTTTIPNSSGGPPPSRTSVTINHNLGKISSYRAWFDPEEGRRYPAVAFSDQNDIYVFPYATENTLVFEVINTSGGDVDVTFYWRIYYDAN